MKFLISAKTHTKFYAEVQHGVFIAAVKKSGAGFAIHIEQNDPAPLRGRLLNEFYSQLLTDTFDIKIISNISTEFVQSYLKERGIAVHKEVKMTETFEVIFDPSYSQLKVAKKSEANSSAQSTLQQEITATSTVSQSTSGSNNNNLIAIGSSTGGVEALMKIFSSLPQSIPPIVVSQHIPADFSRTLCDRFNKMFKFEVKEAADGDEIKANRILIAPGGKHLRVRKDPQGKLIASITDDAPINRHRPSVDALFKSVAEVCGANAIGVILTGMGDDGAKGLLEMKEKGAYTIAQSKETCVVFGMPRVAIELGGVNKIVPLNDIASEVLKSSNKAKAA